MKNKVLILAQPKSGGHFLAALLELMEYSWKRLDVREGSSIQFDENNYKKMRKNLGDYYVPLGFINSLNYFGPNECAIARVKYLEEYKHISSVFHIIFLERSEEGRKKECQRWVGYQTGYTKESIQKDLNIGNQMLEWKENVDTLNISYEDLIGENTRVKTINKIQETILGKVMYDSKELYDMAVKMETYTNARQ